MKHFSLWTSFTPSPNKSTSGEQQLVDDSLWQFLLLGALTRLFCSIGVSSTSILLFDWPAVSFSLNSCSPGRGGGLLKLSRLTGAILLSFLSQICSSWLELLICCKFVWNVSLITPLIGGHAGIEDTVVMHPWWRKSCQTRGRFMR